MQPFSGAFFGADIRYENALLFPIGNFAMIAMIGAREIGLVLELMCLPKPQIFGALCRRGAQSTRVGYSHYYKKTAEVVTIESAEDRRVARRAKGPIEKAKTMVLEPDTKLSHFLLKNPKHLLHNPNFFFCFYNYT